MFFNSSFLCAESNEERRGYEEEEVTPAALTGKRARRKRQLLIAIGAVSGGSAAVSSKQGNLSALNWHQVYRQYSDYCNGTQKSRKYVAAEAIRCMSTIALCLLLETVKQIYGAA